MTGQESLASGAAGFISGYLVLLMATSAYAKLSDFQRFKGIVGGYRMVPVFLIPGVAIVVTVLELILAILLVIPISVLFALVSAALLLLTYAMIAAIAIRRGDAGVPCGCGPSEQTIGWPLVLKNSCLASFSMWIAYCFGGENRDLVLIILMPLLGFSAFLMERTVAQLVKNNSNGLVRTQPRTLI